ncbi:hypothetical protein INR49_024510 [Caranx melampygus]|nr:hypothetical protein INR49_024510 [Caranx melampygus]
MVPGSILRSKSPKETMQQTGRRVIALHVGAGSREEEPLLQTCTQIVGFAYFHPRGLHRQPGEDHIGATSCSRLHHLWSLQTAPSNQQTNMAPFEKSMELMPFKQRKCLETRKDEVCSIRSKFPNKLPVIVERYIREKTLPLLDKTKFLVPFELTLGQFLCLLRNKIALDPTQALFLLVAERSMSCMSSSMGEVYSRYSDADGFLYITYASQEMFGAPQPPC